MRMLASVLLWVVAASATAQFEILDAKTMASLRGIDAVSAQVAWASGSGGTVLLTVDGGTNWKHCAVPPGGDKLDFRGVQGFDAKTAVIMASGKGPASAIYKTTDGCASWVLTFANPDAEGFFDAIRKTNSGRMILMGDPVTGHFTIFESIDYGVDWHRMDSPGLDADKRGGAFAASNSGLLIARSSTYFGTGGSAAADVYRSKLNCPGDVCGDSWTKHDSKLAAGTAGAGVFSLAAADGVTVAVGGDYTKPDQSTGTASVSTDGTLWTIANTLPHGYRSAVAFDAATRRWLAVGPNGADVSSDGGRNWTALVGETASGWNAISLPFVVGGKGKVGKLKAGALAK